MTTISILLKTLDRYETTREAFEHNMKAMKHGLSDEYQFELLVCDNGSEDKRVVDYFAPIADYHRVNSINEGCAKADNQLFLRSHGNYIVCLGSDNFLPPGALAESIKELDNMHTPGAIGISDGAPENRGPGYITGIFVFKRRAIEDVGFYYDGFNGYGCEDLELNERLIKNGYECKMLEGFKGHHSAHLPTDSWKYRANKFNSFILNSIILEERLALIREGKLLTVPLPEKRAPL